MQFGFITTEVVKFAGFFNFLTFQGVAVGLTVGIGVGEGWGLRFGSKTSIVTSSVFGKMASTLTASLSSKTSAASWYVPGPRSVRSMITDNAIERAEVAILIIDATSSITAQDTHIAGYIKDAFKSAIVVVNKWDLIEKDTFTINAFTDHIRQELNFMDYVPMIFISAKTGQRVDKVLPLALRVQEERLVRLSTSQINKIIQTAQDMHPAPSRTGRSLRIYYGTQVRSDPPTFLLYVNDPELGHFTYLRYLENQFRKHYPFIGTPIRLVLKKRRE